jgi:hypothetical protein
VNVPRQGSNVSSSLKKVLHAIGEKFPALKNDLIAVMQIVNICSAHRLITDKEYNNK